MLGVAKVFMRYYSCPFVLLVLGFTVVHAQPTGREVTPIEPATSQPAARRLRPGVSSESVINPWNVELGEVGKLGRKLPGINSSASTIRVLQVSGPDDMLIEVQLQHRTIQGWQYKRLTIWVHGLDTRRYVDNAEIDLPGYFEVSRTKTYQNVLGGTTTVFLIEPFDIEPYLAAEREAAERERLRKIEHRHALLRGLGVKVKRGGTLPGASDNWFKCSLKNPAPERIRRVMVTIVPEGRPDDVVHMIEFDEIDPNATVRKAFKWEFAEKPIASVVISGLPGPKAESTCRKCGDAGMIRCTACFSKGTIMCQMCSGTGYRTRVVYSGSGLLKKARKVHNACSTCGGKGKKLCSRCGGRGTEQCPSCKGRPEPGPE